MADTTGVSDTRGMAYAMVMEWMSFLRADDLDDEKPIWHDHVPQQERVIEIDVAQWPAHAVFMQGVSDSERIWGDPTCRLSSLYPGLSTPWHHFILTYQSLNKGGILFEYELFATYSHFIQGYLHFILTYPSLNKGGRMHEYELFAAYPHFIQGYLHFAITLSFGIWVWTKVVYCMNINYLQSVLTLSRAIFTLPSLCPYATKSNREWNRVWMWTNLSANE